MTRNLSASWNGIKEDLRWILCQSLFAWALRLMPDCEEKVHYLLYLDKFHEREMKRNGLRIAEIKARRGWK